MLLPLAALTMLAAQCAPGIDVKDLQALARTESGLNMNTLAIHDNTSGKSHSPADKEQAVALATQLIGERHSVDLGLMQINSTNFEWLSLTVANAFEPCDSLQAARRHLQAFSRYNTGSPSRGFQNGYVQKVVAARQPQTDRMQEAAARSSGASPKNVAEKSGPLLIQVKPRDRDWNLFADPVDHSMFAQR